MLDVDSRYPALSNIAHSFGQSLNDLGGTPPSQGEYLGFRGCCWWVRAETDRWQAPDPYNYLATLNEVFARLPSESVSRLPLWKKILNGSGSSLLDAVAECAWFLHFWDTGHSVELEKLVDASNPVSKNVDVVVTINGVQHWLDVYHPGPEGPDEVKLPYSLDSVVGFLATCARRKYKAKFYKAVTAGRLQGTSVGVLLCILKYESLLPAFWLGVPSPPPNLFAENHPGLTVVWIHTLRHSSSSDVLRPLLIVPWSRPSVEMPNDSR